MENDINYYVHDHNMSAKAIIRRAIAVDENSPR